ncbi:hypothetical protein GCM10022197_11670 [Microlunatus spumicola]|uniref:RAMA domain-containing protein n=1 Tax=Microlunatus spumicola TaxID=81499 RepID=A0ABP6WYZ2_9ACTN
MPKINVTLDQDVYDELATHVRGFETPNEVIRRLLFGEQDGTSRKPPAAVRRPGGLMKLISAGLVKPGDRLAHYQKRKNETHLGTVDADGWITTKLDSYASPSPALGDLVGTSISGPDFWVHERSGKTINQLKAQL